MLNWSHRSKRLGMFVQRLVLIQAPESNQASLVQACIAGVYMKAKQVQASAHACMHAYTSQLLKVLLHLLL